MYHAKAVRNSCTMRWFDFEIIQLQTSIPSTLSALTTMGVWGVMERRAMQPALRNS